MSQDTWPDISRIPPGVEIPWSIEEAQAFLEFLLSITKMLQLYQECFPEAWSCDEDQNVPIFPARGADYSPREVHFFCLVDEHYFPLPITFLPEDLYGERHLTANIPVGSMGFDLYDDEQYEGLPFGWKLLLYLLGEVDEAWLRNTEEQVDKGLFSIPVSRGDVSIALLLLRSEAQGGTLASLPLAIQMLRNDTESVWLNVTRDDPCIDALWTKADMEEMRWQYHLACTIRAAALSLCEWLEENPVRHFAMIVCLWNTCVRDTPKRGTGPRVMHIPVGTFVDGIHFGELFGQYIALPERRATESLDED